MKTTREKILRTLLAYPGSTINDLAEAVGVNSISIRHHLTALEVESLIQSSEERHGVGRPRLTYRLTEAGVEKFPTSYLRLTDRLLTILQNQMNDETYAALFEAVGLAMAAEHHLAANQSRTNDAQIADLKTILDEEGFIFEIIKTKSSISITFLSCPYYHIVVDHPQVCAIDHALLTAWFGEPINRIACILNGDNHCIYEIDLPSTGDIND